MKTIKVMMAVVIILSMCNSAEAQTPRDAFSYGDGQNKNYRLKGQKQETWSIRRIIPFAYKKENRIEDNRAAATRAAADRAAAQRASAQRTEVNFPFLYPTDSRREIKYPTAYPIYPAEKRLTVGRAVENTSLDYLTEERMAKENSASDIVSFIFPTMGRVVPKRAQSDRASEYTSYAVPAAAGDDPFGGGTSFPKDPNDPYVPIGDAVVPMMLFGMAWIVAVRTKERRQSEN